MSGRGRQGLLIVVASSLALLTTVAARASSELFVSLDYEVDSNLAGCPTAPSFRADVARQLGRDPFKESASRKIVVQVYPSDVRTEGRLEWRGPNNEWEGERGFSSRTETCAQIVRAMALTTAIQIQLLAGSERAPPEPVLPAPTKPETPVIATAAPSPAPAPAPTPKEPRVAIEVGVGVLQDFGDAPRIVVPSLAVWIGRPSGIGLRLAASGLGPGADVARPEGSAQIDRFVMTAGLVRAFRTDRRVQPFLAAGVGWQELRAEGTAAMPSLAQARSGRAFSGLVTAGGGLLLAVAAPLSVIIQVEALFLWPAVTIQVGAADAARFGNATLSAHGGLLARF